MEINAQEGKVQLSFDEIINLFHQLYYHVGQSGQGAWNRTWWMGWKTEKCPMDLWIYQELLTQLRPQLIIETGTRHGGSALYLCHMADLLNLNCEIITVDVNRPTPEPEHPRLTMLTGSSTETGIVEQVRQRASGKTSVMVILDSDHTRDHVLGEMKAYHDLVTPGNYMIVEDTNVNGHPVWPEFGPGPMEALQAFFAENQDFEVDLSCQRHLMTLNPSGFLRKKFPPGTAK